MTFTEIQQAFVDIGTQYSTTLLQAHFNLEQTSEEGIDVLDAASTLMDTAGAGILLVGVLSIPATLGAGFAAAVSMVVLAKTARESYKWYQSFSENTPDIPYSDAVKRDIKYLRMQVQLQRAIYQYAVRYAYVLQEIIDKKSLYRFSMQTTSRLMKIMLASMKADTQEIPNAEDLLDGLLASATLSVNKKIDWVTVQHPRSGLMLISSTKMPSKLLWACPRWYVFDEDLQGEFIGSPQEHDFLKTTTLRECGVIAVPREKLQLASLAVNFKPYKSLRPSELNESFNQMVRKLCFFYPVTRSDVEGYLEHVRQSPSSKPPSLNFYLSGLFEKSVIAVCHNAALKQMDLRGGCFSDVDFCGADLSGCDLRDTDWSGRYTWLPKVQFNQVIVNENTTFQAAHAEESVWTDVKFARGMNLILTKVNGATLVDCVMSAGCLLQLGTDWLLVTFKNLRVDDPAVTLEMDFKNKLNLERQQRLQLQEDINRIIKAYDDQSNLIDAGIKQGNIETVQASAVELKEAWSNLKKEQIVWFSEYDAQLNQALERCELLEKACSRAEVAIGELQHFRQEEEQRWSEQSYADTLRDQRIASLEPSQSVVNRLLHYCKEEINTRGHQLIKRTYVELKVASILAGKDAELESLTECIDRYVHAESGVLLLHGEPGCGKSITLKLLFEELLKLLFRDLRPYSPSNASSSNAKERVRLIPIFIDLYQIQDWSRNALRCGLERYLDKAQVDYLIEHEHCLIMVDNIDVGQVSLSKLLQDFTELSEHFTHKPKFIFSTKTSYLLSLERDYREIFISSQLNLDAEYVVQAFDSHQVKRFFSFYHAEKAYQRFQVLQAQNVEVRSLLKSPLMLGIIVGAFFSDSFNAENIAFRSDFYEASWRALHEHVMHLLPDQYKVYKDFIAMIQQLAIVIFTQGQDWVKRPFEIKLDGQSQQDLLSCLFNAKIRYLSFLSITKKNDALYIRFMHASLGHYWVAQRLLSNLSGNDFLSEQALHLWNLRSLRNFPDILNFLVELIQKHPDQAVLQRRLMDIVMLTRISVHQHLSMAASNAMTLRCRLNNNFNHMDLSNIAIPYADLTEGLFVGTIFYRSKLNGVRFVRATLLWANMRETDLTHTQFLDATSFIQMEGPLKTFAVYPSLSETIIAVVVEPKNTLQCYHIALISIQDGVANKIRVWSAHNRSIYAMAWGIRDDMAYLASAGEGGTIRIWSFKEGIPGVVEEVKLSDKKFKKPINTLVWAPNGQLIVSGSEQVCIWNVSRREKIYQSAILPVSRIRTLLWAKEPNLLMAIDDGSVLFLWKDPDQSEVSSRLRQFVLEGLFPQSIASVCCMALSWNEQQLALGQANGNILVISIGETLFGETSLKPIILSGHKRRVNSLCWVGSILSSSSDDHTVRVWRNAKYPKILPHEHAVGHVALLPSGRGLVSGVDSRSPRIYFWNIDQPNEERLTFDPLGGVMCLGVCPTPSLGLTKIAVGFVNGAVMLYAVNKQTHRVTPALLWEHEHSSVSQLSWSEDGRFLASFCKDGTMMVQNIQMMTPRMWVVLPTANIGFSHMAWLKNPIYLSCFVVGFSDGSLYFYDTTQAVLTENNHTLQASHQIRAPSSRPLHGLAATASEEQPSRVTLAIAGEEKIEILVVDIPADNQLVCTRVISFPHSSNATAALAWSSNGHHLASVTQHQSICIWSQRGVCVYHYPLNSEIKCVRWNETHLMVGTMNAMWVWDTRLINGIRSPIPIPIGAPLFTEDASDLILAENGAVWICDRDKLFAGEGPASWVMQVKPDLLAHQVNESAVQGSPSTKTLLQQKGGVTDAREKFGLFPPWRHQTLPQTPRKLPKPSTRDELYRLWFRQFSSGSFNLNAEHSESTSNPSPRVGTGSDDGSK